MDAIFFSWIARLYTWSVPYNGIKEGDIKYHFLSLWYDNTWIWSPFSVAIREHSTPWKQHLPQQQLYVHWPSITNTIQIRWTIHTRQYWRSKDDCVSDVILSNPSHKYASVGQATRIHLQQLCTDTGWTLLDLPEAKDDRDECRKRVGKNCANCMMMIIIWSTLFTSFTP